ncbi:unnamed protein product [Lactuca virosa]|uniref:Uncharacterized protein n=1 Tax=Lactuca virosa TaxID=75947 RepID=A0AAU9MP49_9ASTR|nr:unnamed protein product [Lactuca virosa]
MMASQRISSRKGHLLRYRNKIETMMNLDHHRLKNTCHRNRSVSNRRVSREVEDSGGYEHRTDSGKPLFAFSSITTPLLIQKELNGWKRESVYEFGPYAFIKLKPIPGR